MFKQLLLLFMLSITAIFLVACSENGDNKPANGNAQVSGMAALGKVVTSTITAYDFTACQKGNALSSTGSQESDQFNFNIQVGAIGKPVLFEVSNFTYEEEIGGALINSGDYKLYGLTVLNNGDNEKVAITYWTSLAYARATYHCQSNSEDTTAIIKQSNQQFSDALTVDIIRDQPLPISTQTLNFDRLDSIRYGIANAALSKYSYMIDRRLAPQATPHTTHNSIEFVNIATEDLIYDGFLNGTGKQGILVYADVMLDADVYRTDIGNNIDDIVAVSRTKPTFDTDLINGVAASFHASGLDIFGGAQANKALGDSTVPVVTQLNMISCVRKLVPSLPQLQDATSFETTFDIEMSVQDPDSIFSISSTLSEITQSVYDPITGIIHIKINVAYITYSSYYSESSYTNFENYPINKIDFVFTNRSGLQNNVTVSIDNNTKFTAGNNCLVTQ